MSKEYELSPAEPLKAEQVESTSAWSILDSFKHHLPRLIITVLIDVFIPLLMYFLLKDHMPPVYSLLISSSPPLFMVIFKGVWERSFDGIGFIVCFAFILAAILAVLFDNPILLLVEKSWLTGAGAILFGITLIPFRCGRFKCRPMVYYFYHDLFPITRAEFGLPDDMFESDQYTELKDHGSSNRSAAVNMKEVAQIYSWLYENCSSFRATCYFMTCVWIIAFATECFLRYAFIVSGMSIDSIFIYGQIVFLIIVLVCATLQLGSMVVERKHTLEYIARWKLEHKLNTSRT